MKIALHRTHSPLRIAKTIQETHLATSVFCAIRLLCLETKQFAFAEVVIYVT